MCLIIAKPQGQLLPTDSIIQTAFKNNSDGFGLAYYHPEDQLVHIRKGAMKLKHVFHLLQSVPNPEEADMLLHFRLATQGTVSPGNCHPFPLARKVGKLTALNIDCSMAITHNGIIWGSFSNSYVYGEGLDWQGAIKNNKSKLSDTQEFIQDYLVNLGHLILHPGVMKLIEAHTESKWGFLEGGKLALVGEFTEEDGLFYSNTSYKYAYATVETSTNYGTEQDAKFCEICGGAVTFTYTIEEMKVCYDCWKCLKPYGNPLQQLHDGFP